MGQKKTLFLQTSQFHLLALCINKANISHYYGMATLGVILNLSITCLYDTIEPSVNDHLKFQD